MHVKNIIVGIDFSKPSELAAQAALRLARRHGARLYLMYAGAVPDFSQNQPETSFSISVEAMNSSELRHAREQLEALRERLDKHGVDIVHAVIDGPPAAALARAAREVHADLMVVGSYGRTGLQHLLLGSVAERVTRTAPCPVLVVREDFPATGAKNALVPIDFSGDTEKTMDVSLAFVDPQAKVELFHAVAPIDMSVYGAGWALPEGIAGLRREIKNEMEKQGRPLVEKLTSRVATVAFEAEEGYAVDAILRRITARKHDLVIVGSHGRGRVAQLLLGSVAERVIRHAPCSVLVVRTRANADTDV